MKKKSKLTSKNADIYDLYERSVQSVEFEVEFIEKMFKKYNRGKCLDIREDFCATASISATWVKGSKKKTAFAIDLDKKILNVAKKRINKSLSEEQSKRLHLIHGDCASTVPRIILSLGQLHL